MVENPVRRKLLAGGTAFGTMAFDFFTPGLAPTLAAAGAEFVILDMEHGGLGIEGVKAQCAFARGAGIVPMVRIPEPRAGLVPPILDAGALGIMMPLVESAEQARALVAASRYRPEGRRGLGFSVAHDRYTGGDPQAKIHAANDGVLTIALIESEAGAANAAEIAAVPGIDLLWLGHFDLSDCLGIPGRFDDPRYRAAAGKLRDAAHEAGKPIGWVAADATQARDALGAGFRCLCIGHEVMVLREALSSAFAVARSTIPAGNPAGNPGKGGLP
ncbi:HpcH/HpaI aldolase family protein [Falsiroseomonas sp. HW251]|uniref:HpcH/HpaI aldolase family protein n=1 Tax=Falsiroseomonas sp. HW251 TaxID=3390998 RepID=UPI003D3103BB